MKIPTPDELRATADAIESYHNDGSVCIETAKLGTDDWRDIYV